MKDIQWGDKFRPLKKADICRGFAKKGNKQDLRGWIIEFFGENTRAAIAIERHISEKKNIPTHFLELWSNDATIEEQVESFNDAIKVLIPKRRFKKYGFYKRFKNGNLAKKPKEIVEAKNKTEAKKIFGNSDEYECFEV